jgi:hypothetical protein
LEPYQTSSISLHASLIHSAIPFSLSTISISLQGSLNLDGVDDGAVGLDFHNGNLARQSLIHDGVHDELDLVFLDGGVIGLSLSQWWHGMTALWTTGFFVFMYTYTYKLV